MKIVPMGVGATILGAFWSMTAAAAEPSVAAPRLDALAIRTALIRSEQGAPMPSDAAELDRLLAIGDFGRLVPRLRDAAPADRWLDLNWERARILDGAGFAIVYAYLSSLWRVGTAAPVSVGDGLKQSAGMMLAYGLDLVALDGLKCADPSAPVHRRDQLTTLNPDLLRFVATQPRSVRMTMGTISLAIEKATADLRRNDETLCSGGLDEISAGLAAQGDRPMAEVPSAPGVIGRTVVVPTAPGYHPKFVTDGVWQPKQAALRATMAATLTRMLTVPGDAATTDAKAALPTHP